MLMNSDEVLHMSVMCGYDNISEGSEINQYVTFYVQIGK